MRKLLTWIVVTAGIAALVRKLRSKDRGSTAESAVADVERIAPDSPPDGNDPADELRQRLASTRGSESEPDPPTPQPSSEPTIDDRRTEVHDDARAAIDEMRKSAED